MTGAPARRAEASVEAAEASVTLAELSVGRAEASVTLAERPVDRAEASADRAPGPSPNTASATAAIATIFPEVLRWVAGRPPKIDIAFVRKCLAVHALGVRDAGSGGGRAVRSAGSSRPASKER